MTEDRAGEQVQAQEVRSRHLLALVAELLRKNEELRMELARLREENTALAVGRPNASPAHVPKRYEFQA